MLGLNGTSVELLASAVLVPSQNFTFGTELAHFSWKLERETLVYAQEDTKHRRGSRCKEAIELSV